MYSFAAGSMHFIFYLGNSVFKFLNIKINHTLRNAHWKILKNVKKVCTYVYAHMLKADS